MFIVWWFCNRGKGLYNVLANCRILPAAQEVLKTSSLVSVTSPPGMAPFWARQPYFQSLGIWQPTYPDTKRRALWVLEIGHATAQFRPGWIVATLAHPGPRFQGTKDPTPETTHRGWEREKDTARAHRAHTSMAQASDGRRDLYRANEFWEESKNE